MSQVPKIVDLSHHQDKVQFGELKAAGIEAVILKATQGTTYSDPKFGGFHTRARFKGLHIGAYHFVTGEDPNAQLDFFLRTVQPYGPMVLCLDYEHNPNSGGEPTEKILTAMVQGMVKRLGRHPVLYGSDGSWLGPLLAKRGISQALKNCRRWIARYGPEAPKTKCDIWQYTSTGQIGDMGPLDLNVWVSEDYPTVQSFWDRFEI